MPQAVTCGDSLPSMKIPQAADAHSQTRYVPVRYHTTCTLLIPTFGAAIEGHWDKMVVAHPNISMCDDGEGTWWSPGSMHLLWRRVFLLGLFPSKRTCRCNWELFASTCIDLTVQE